MPIAEQTHFHCQYKKFTRSQGKSAVASAAYRLGMKLHDERTGLTHDYTRKSGVTDILTITPAGQRFPNWINDHQALWNEVEAAEKNNPRSLVMHELEIALPSQLTHAKRMEAAIEMAQFVADRYGCVAQAAFHNPGKEGDERNYHVHLMFTSRAITEQGFTKKKFRNFSRREEEAREQNEITGAEEIVFIRQQWEAIGNRHLEKAGHEPTLDHRSYEDQDIDLEPQKHLGPDATAKERRGQKTAKGDFNRAVTARNANRLKWTKAWEQTKIDITGKPLPALPVKPSKASRDIMERQKQERTSLIHLHITEKKNLWRKEQEIRLIHKKQWVQVYRRQHKDREAINAKPAKWTKRLLRLLDFTGKQKKQREQVAKTLEARQKIERSHLGRTHRETISKHQTRLHTKQEKELRETDSRHLQQRTEIIKLETYNQEVLKQLRAKQRQRDKDRDKGKDRGREP